MHMCIEKIMLRRKVAMEFTQIISTESAANWKHQIYSGICIQNFVS